MKVRIEKDNERYRMEIHTATAKKPLLLTFTQQQLELLLSNIATLRSINQLTISLEL